MTTRHLDKRLTPLTDEQYSVLDAQSRSHDQATCPCCATSTTQGWLDDVGCCYDCDRVARNKAARRPTPAPLDIRLVRTKDGYRLTGIM